MEWNDDRSRPAALDAVVTSMCVHHLTDGRKQSLFTEIFDHLALGGWYLNYDPVRAEDPLVEATWQRVNDREDPETAARRRDADAHFCERVPGLLEHFGSVQQRLRRHASDIEAGAAERGVLLDHGDLHAELRRAYRADISARTSADDDEIVSGHD